MQPTQASETRLPRAVLRRSAAIAERIAARDKPPVESEALIPETTPPASAAPAEPPKIAIAAGAKTEAELEAVYSENDDPRKNDVAYWKSRALSTAGLLARERMENVNRTNTLRQQMTELQSEVDTLKSQAPEPEPKIEDFFTPEEIEKYGPEQCKVMARTAMRANRKAEKPVAAAQPPKTPQPDEAQQRAVAKFQDELTEHYPDWPTADKDKRWLAWLDEIDIATGEPRGRTLDAFVVTGNARGAAGMFRAWEKSLAPAPVAATPPPPPPAPPMTPSSRAATPGPGDAPSVPANAAAAAKGRPSAKEIKDFYTRASTKRKGQPGYVTDQERADFEARIALPAAA
jgi:hypothetical protein